MDISSVRKAVVVCVLALVVLRSISGIMGVNGYQYDYSK